MHPAEVPALEPLGLPAAAVASLTALRAGLVLVSGPAGSGRTTTAAAVVARHVAAGRAALTVEEPIELVLTHGPGVVNQVEPGPEGRADPGLTLAGAAALARDLDAEVVLLDHVDDPARAALALDLAAQGRLVVTTIAARHPRDALSRLELHAGDGPAARAQVARHVALVVAQRLEPRTDGAGRAPVCELLLPSAT